MTKRLRGLEALTLAAVVALAASCATTGGDVDVTPTVRTSVDAHIGKNLNSDGNRIENIANDFTPNETVFAIVDVPGKIDGTMRVRWVYGGSEVIDEQSVTVQEGVNVYPFRLMAPTGGHRVGDYRFEVYINNDRAETESFRVRA